MSTPMDRRAIRRQQQDDQVQNIIDTIADPGDQLDAISKIRGWYNPHSTANLIIKQYLSDDLSLSDTVTQLANPIDDLFTSGDNGWSAYTQEKTARHQREHFPEDAEQWWGVEQDILKPDEGSENDHVSTEGALWTLWYAVVHSARKLFWRDNDDGSTGSSQTALLELVRALKARPNPPLPPHLTVPMQRDWVYASGATLWRNLLLLGPSFRESWNDSPGCGAGWSKPEVEAWINAEAFVARLTVCGVKKFWNYGVWALRDGLEERPNSIYFRPEREEEVLDCYVTAAAVWVVIAGKEMWEFVERDRDFETRYGLDEALPKLPWEGDGVWTRARWRYWKEKFESVAQRPGLVSSTKQIIGEALKCMEAVESQRQVS
ncbi:hypothetical protein Slin15195_G068080 [Septoria linicola]|uniref:Uncharacterized protein n=1 Tax=Septoria linicola TaxID=215465 RepID=A0A9Q9EKP5_9PEZI|nr:hypothetical protein Slin15195_G068080 [Septoria linicola]